MSKGSRWRSNVNMSKFYDNFDKIFGKQEDKVEKTEKPKQTQQPSKWYPPR